MRFWPVISLLGALAAQSVFTVEHTAGLVYSRISHVEQSSTYCEGNG